MLNQQQTNCETNPLANFLSEEPSQFATYEKHLPSNYKSRAQKNRERVQKLTKHVTDPQLKKQKRTQRKLVEKSKLHQMLDSMTKEEARVYLDTIKSQKAALKRKVREAMKGGQIIMLDLVYEQKMNEKENKSLSKQIQLIMRAIKLTSQPPSIHLCSLKGNLQQQLQKRGYKFWALTPHKQNVLQVAASLGKKLIYLSPDAELQLQSVERDTCYVLGGLIDRTILKNASLTRARELGVESRKLPIAQFMKGRLCLNLDHVVSMLCKFAEAGCWKTAFDYAAPKRWKKESENNQKQEDSASENQEQEKGQLARGQGNENLKPQLHEFTDQTL